MFLNRAFTLGLLLFLPGTLWASPLRLALEAAAVAEALPLTTLAHEAQAQRAEAKAMRALPDPQLRFGLTNLPVDSLSWAQEPMTQMQFSLRQAFPNGAARGARYEADREQAQGTEEARALAALEVRAAVRTLLVDLAWRDQQEALLVQQLRVLDQVHEQALSAFEAGLGQEGDVLEARLAREQRVRARLVNEGRRSALRAALLRWVPESFARQAQNLDFEQLFPAMKIWPSLDEQRAQLQRHPMLRQRNAALARAQAQRRAAEADYGPSYAVDVAYGARDELSPLGPRPDFFSAGVTITLPLFSREKQDQNLTAAQLRQEGQRAAYLDALRALGVRYDSQQREAQDQDRALAHYQAVLSPLAERHWQRSLARYGEGTVDFERAIQAALTYLDTKEAYLALRRERAVTESDLLFLTAEALPHG
ncbi:MAG: TolC family protein [Pseudomonadales bacterium]|nr:TolC family protein [Pseudomonadales bacterium]